MDTDKSVDRTRKKVRSRLCTREYQTKKPNEIQRALPASHLFSAVAPLEAVKALVLIKHDVGEFVKRKETIEVETVRNQRSTFPRNSPVKDRQKYGEDKVGRLAKSMYGMLRIRRLPKRQTQRSIVPQSESKCERRSA